MIAEARATALAVNPLHRLPAFGRRLVALRHAGLVPSTRQVVIAVADWKLANTKREDLLVVPPGEQPSSLDWHYVAGETSPVLSCWSPSTTLKPRMPSPPKSFAQGAAVVRRSSTHRLPGQLDGVFSSLTLRCRMSVKATPEQQKAFTASSQSSQPCAVLVCAADVKPERVHWLWPDWLAAGKFHVLAVAPRHRQDDDCAGVGGNHLVRWQMAGWHDERGRRCRDLVERRRICRYHRAAT